MAYRIYVTDSFYHEERREIWTVRYEDLINGNAKRKREADGDKIALEVIEKAGIRCKE